MRSRERKPINGTRIEWDVLTLPEPRCPRCDAAINVERVGTDLFVSDCCGKPFRWPPTIAPVKGS